MVLERYRADIGTLLVRYWNVEYEQMAAINQKEDLPDDTLNPTYKFGYGISY